MEFTILETMKREVMFKKKKTLILHTEQICSHTYSRVVSSFPILRRESISQKRGILSTEEVAFNTNAKCCIQFCQTRGRFCPHSFQKFGGKLQFRGNPPSLTSDATLIQYLTGRILYRNYTGNTFFEGQEQRTYYALKRQKICNLYPK